jgi:diguanylate cyclase (GGDEF)-like protein
VLAQSQPAQVPVLFAHTFFYFELAVRLPGAEGWAARSPAQPALNPGWPADLAVLPLEEVPGANDEIALCVETQFVGAVRVGIAPRSALQSSTLGDIRVSALTEGTLAAMTLAALGMSLVLQRLTFLLLAGGLAMALLYLVVSNGSLLEFPVGVWLMRELPMQRIAGIGASILLGLGLARFAELPARYPRLWRGFIALIAAMAVLLLLSIAPTPLRFLGIAVYSNAVMVAILLSLLGAAVAGAVQRHRPSIGLLLAWGPAMVMVMWMSVAVSAGSTLSSAARWLFPLTLVYACSSLFTELARRIAATQAERDLARLRARTDKLTGAMTRDELETQLSALHALAATAGRGYSLLFLDFDHFKSINDAYGHAVGDAVLSVATERIQAQLRSRDSLGRYGGEEFVVLLEGLDASDAREVAERIRLDIENGGAPLAEGLPPLTLSIGITCHTADRKETAEDALERADAALYAAKAAGRNRVQVAD